MGLSASQHSTELLLLVILSIMMIMLMIIIMMNLEMMKINNQWDWQLLSWEAKAAAPCKLQVAMLKKIKYSRNPMSKKVKIQEIFNKNVCNKFLGKIFRLENLLTYYQAKGFNNTNQRISQCLQPLEFDLNLSSSRADLWRRHPSIW